MDTTQFAKLFVESVVLKYGVPTHLISDRDPRWTSAFWRAVAKELGIHLSLSSAHHPQHDGQTEAVNQTLETMLRAYVHADRSAWAKWLPLVCHAYNSSHHSATGYTPHFLLYGMEASTDLDKLAELEKFADDEDVLRDAFEFYTTFYKSPPAIKVRTRIQSVFLSLSAQPPVRPSPSSPLLRFAPSHGRVSAPRPSSLPRGYLPLPCPSLHESSASRVTRPRSFSPRTSEVAAEPPLLVLRGHQHDTRFWPLCAPDLAAQCVTVDPPNPGIS